MSDRSANIEAWLNLFDWKIKHAPPSVKRLGREYQEVFAVIASNAGLHYSSVLFKDVKDKTEFWEKVWDAKNGRSHALAMRFLAHKDALSWFFRQSTQDSFSEFAMQSQASPRSQRKS